MRTCPICRGPVAARPENPAVPFCGERCRLIDLGRWLTGDYRIPAAPAPLPDDDAAETPGAAKGEP